MSSRSSLSFLGFASLLLSAGACAQILGLDQFTEGGTGGGGTTSTTGAGGTGGDLPITCSPGEVKACPYGGPGATENRGLCKAGTQSCLPNGSGFGACSGEVQPTKEDCATPDDEDCDGTPNQAAAGCACAPGTMEPCYEGDPSSAHKGSCRDGTHTCNAEGKAWGPCEGQVLPKPESCATPEDDSCDGQANEGCPCTPNAVSACYSGDPATKGEGLCKEGTWTCMGDGTGYGPCMGEALPAASDDCANQVDEDCSGTYCTEAVWAKSYFGGVLRDMVVDATGNSYITGFFHVSFGLPNPPLSAVGSQDGYVAKLDPTGALAWIVQIGDLNDQLSIGIALDSTNNVILTGYFKNSVTFGATTLGGPGNDSYQIFVAKLDNDGNALWARQFGDPAGSLADQLGNAVTVDASDNIIFAGQFATQVDLGTGITIPAKGTTDAFIAKLNKTGTTTLYAKTYGAAGSSTKIKKVAADSAGNAMAIGTFTGSVNFGFAGPTTANANGDDAFLLRVSPAGNSAWLKTFGNGNKISFADVKVDTAGRSTIAGSFQGTIAVGGTMLTVPMNGGQSNFFVAQFNAGGATNWATQYGNSVYPGAVHSTIRGLGADASGNLFLAGTCIANFDLGYNLSCNGAGAGSPFIIMTNSAGMPLWGRAYGSGSLEFIAASSAPFVSIGGASGGMLDLGKGGIPSGSILARIATQ